MTPWLLLGLALLLLVGNAVFVAAETALVTVERSEVDEAAHRQVPRAGAVQAALRRLSTQLSAAQLGITVTSLAIGLLTEPSLARLLHDPIEHLGLDEDAAEPVAVVAALLVASVVQMVLGELVPKNLALARPLQTALVVVRPQVLFALLTRPVVKVLNGAANRLLTRVGVEPAEELRSARTPEELALLLQQSAEGGSIGEGDATVLVNALSLGELRATDVQTPRVRVRFVEESAPVTSVLTAARESGHSRFPVIRHGSDEVIGLVHVKHAVAVPSGARRTRRVRDIMTAPVLVPTSLPLHDLLSVLRSPGIQMAVVIDEFGGTDGVVTLEDVVEELVGEVRDESDVDDAGDRSRRRRDGSWLLSGLLRPDEATDLTGCFVPEGPYETLGGLLQLALGQVGSTGDEVPLGNGAVLRIERMQGRRIERVVLVPPRDDPGGEE